MDETYESPVWGDIFAMLELPDGRTLVSGDLSSRLGSTQMAVGRLLADGSLDATYPVVSSNGDIEAMILQPDGKILLYGTFTQILEQSRNGCARLNADGTLDTSFVPALGSSARIEAAVLQADGKILLAGPFGNINSSTLTLIRLNSDGSFDRSLEAYSSSWHASNLLMQKNGSIVLSGSFEKLNQVPVNRVARLHNGPATESLTVPDATRVLWERGGTAPEALDVYFECSTDEGETWTWLGQGSYITSGWELTGLNLPAAGKVRARAVLQSGHKSRSRGLVETVAAFAFTPAALVVEDGAGQPWVSGASADFGQAGLGGVQRQNLVLKNTGETRLEDIRVEIDGVNAADFRLLEPAIATLPKAGEQSLQLLFIPSQLGTRTAVARIYSSDLTEPMQIQLTGVGIKPLVPTVKTLPATEVHPASVRLNGTVNIRGLVREVFFEYGTTPSLGNLRMLSAGTEEGFEDQTVQQTLSGLLPKTRYYFRIRAASAEGGAVGATLSFVTGNSAPVARDDQWIFVRTPGSLSLNVLANDEDPDGDALSLASFTPPLPEGSGSLVKVGNALVYTPSESGYQSSFTYRVKDAAGALSEPATVRITLNVANLSASNSGLISAAGQTYSLNLRTYALWKVLNPLPWVRVDVMEGFGDRRLQITVLPNTTVKPRSGTISIGYATHAITQDGVLLPVLEQPGLPLPPAYVGAAFELPISTQNLPVIYTVKNLPPGLTISGATGVISGVPTRAGNYAISIKARNVAGAAVDTVLLDLDVNELPREFQGRHEGVISINESQPRSLGGRYELTVTATGAFTGKVTLGSKTEAMKGSLAVDPAVPTKAIGTTTLTSGKNAPLRQFKVELHSDGDGSHEAELLTGGVKTDDGHGWWIPWNGKDRLATAYAETYSFVTSPVESEGSAPEGHGYGSFSVVEKTGAVKISGRLADGTPYISSAFVSGRGDIVVYQSLYSQGGALVGGLAVESHENRALNGVLGALDWVKHPVDIKVKDLAYRGGFGVLELGPRGGVLPKLAPGGRILDLPESESPQAELKFSGGGGPAPFDAEVIVTNPSAKGLTNKATVSTTPEAVTLPVLDVKKGTFSGSFTLAGSAPSLNRKTAFSGQIVQIEGVVKGYGFFMLPELPAEGGSLKTSSRHSGAVLFQAAPSP
ncbi:hypothetical protein GCM10023213_44010 [Prosthecobacter algae]|uniref:BACON domain-containing protein n=1 Tax=Prosthecobacter algae TaxID=1144682 RepID=A0ABP9PMK4_9BACT